MENVSLKYKLGAVVDGYRGVVTSRVALLKARAKEESQVLLRRNIGFAMAGLAALIAWIAINFAIVSLMAPQFDSNAAGYLTVAAINALLAGVVILLGLQPSRKVLADEESVAAAPAMHTERELEAWRDVQRHEQQLAVARTDLQEHIKETFDVRNRIVTHPGTAVAGAFAVGFFVNLLVHQKRGGS